MRVNDQRTIGGTGLRVPVVGLGGAPLGNMYEAFSDEQARATVRAGFDAGMTFFDTAPLYGHTLSERRIGEVLRNLPRSDFVLSTKVGRLMRPVPVGEADGGQFKSIPPFMGVYDYSYDGVMRSVEDSLQRLGLSSIDILLIHDVDVWTHGSEEARLQRFRECMQGAYPALDKLRSEGVVKAIGAGMNENKACEDFARAGDFDCFLLAGRYTLLEQEALDSFLPLCSEKNISILIGGPYNTGILATGAVDNAYYNYQKAPPEIMDKTARIEAVCRAHNVKLPTAALRFTLGHPQVASIIPGARHPDEIERNRAIFEAPVPGQLWSDLKAERLVRDDAPVPE